ncbi:MAG: hypothetical protein SOU03_01375 [Dorea sp.]|nr:hypothetical protein [Dorea sp.]
MNKRRVWKAGSAIFLLLILCSVLSGRIQEAMRIPVWTTKGELREDGEMAVIVIPKTCFSDSEYATVQYLVQEEGIFRTEWKVAEKTVVIVDEMDGGIAVQAEDMKDQEGKSLNVIYYSAYPVCEGDAVTLGDDK